MAINRRVFLGGLATAGTVLAISSRSATAGYPDERRLIVDGWKRLFSIKVLLKCCAMEECIVYISL